MTSAGIDGPHWKFRFRWNNGARRWAAGASVASVYIVLYVVNVFGDHLSMPRTVTSVTLCLLMFVVYVFGLGQVFIAPSVVRWTAVAAVFVLTMPQVLLVGNDAVGLLIFTGVAAGCLLGIRTAAVVGVLLAILMLVLTWHDPAGASWQLGLTVVGLTLWSAGFAKNIRLNIELRQARDELARTAVLAERERIARDLHDILGHSLTAIAVKASLARQLTVRAPDKAAAEIVDIERLARSALADVRATASGIRERSLGAELAAARSVLTAAGIVAVIPGAIDDVRPEGRELFGYVVKEAVTNVVRHSRAANCTVRLGADWIEVVDDGSGPVVGGQSDREDAGGNGLLGLRERVVAAGGTLTAASTQPAGFAVRAELAATS
ncbi:MAG: sensor histidine kinase [Actinomycetota bacterium]|nr:sensor histidine kinase [Actinomycetota bacterium]